MARGETREGIYLRINGTEYRKVYVVGDLHGCHGMLMTHLEEIEFDFDADLLISVGDLIDRGGQNVECLDLITQSWFRAVRGNHEQMAIQALNGTGNVNHCQLTAVAGSSISIMTKRFSLRH